MSTSQNHRAVAVGSRFLGGWGGVLSVMAGIGVALLAKPLLVQILLGLQIALERSGLDASSAIAAIYWVQSIAMGLGFLLAIGGSDARMDRLRGGVGDWTLVVRETLIVAGIVSLWVFGSVAWERFEDAFNQLGSNVELPAVGTLLALLVAGIVLRVARGRRARTES